MKFTPLVAGAVALLCTAAHAQQSQSPTTGSGGTSTTDAWFPPETDFRKVVLDEDAVVNGEATDTVIDPMELTVARDGRVFWAERAGVVKMWKPSDKATVVIASLPVFTGLEEGMLGITLDPDFDRNGWIYLNRSIPETYNDGRGKAGRIRVARFTLKGEQLDLASEKVIIEMEVQREQCCHVGGSLAFDSKGNLYVSIGDNTNPFDSDGFSPSDERKGRYPWDAQGTAANPNSLVGKILRITPKPDGGYTIPDGNLFPPGTAGTRPEIYVMGNRNPFRISIDPRTGHLYWGEVGPDAGGPDPKRGPAGFDEINQARQAGFYGWPLFVGDNRPYRRIDFAERQQFQDLRAAYDNVRKKREELEKKGETNNLPELPPKPAAWEPSGEFWDAARPMNRSPHNTGRQELPPAQPAFIYYPASASTRFPEVGTGGRTAMAGPVYYFDPANPSPTKLPKEFDRTLFIYEWSRDWIIAVKLDADHNLAKTPDGKWQMKRFMPSTKFKRPMDMELGADGCLYLIEFGKDWGNNKDTKIVRIEYTGKGNAGR
jgi:cytochrome c